MQGSKWEIVVLSSYLRHFFIIMTMTLLLNFENGNFLFVMADIDYHENGGNGYGLSR